MVATRPDDCWVRSVAECAAAAVAAAGHRVVPPVDPAGSEGYRTVVPYWSDPSVGPCGGVDPSEDAFRDRCRSPGAVLD